jgi:hypothetical protein
VSDLAAVAPLAAAELARHPYTTRSQVTRLRTMIPMTTIRRTCAAGWMSFSLSSISLPPALSRRPRR